MEKAEAKKRTALSPKLQRGIHAMEVGGLLLQHMAHAGKPVSMVGLSAATNLPVNQVYAYMVSLVRTGLVRRDWTTHRFEPGPLALTLGLRALAQIFPVQRAVRLSRDLLEDPSHGSFVTIWTDHGPTVIQYQSPEAYLDVGLRVGTVLSILHSGAGRLFASFLPQQKLGLMLAREASKGQAQAVHNIDDDLRDLIADIRHTFLSRTEGAPIPGVDSLSAPVFDHAGQMVLSVTVFGPWGNVDTSAEGTLAKGLQRVSDELSMRRQGEIFADWA